MKTSEQRNEEQANLRRKMLLLREPKKHLKLKTRFRKPGHLPGGGKIPLGVLASLSYRLPKVHRTQEAGHLVREVATTYQLTKSRVYRAVKEYDQTHQLPELEHMTYGIAKLYRDLQEFAETGISGPGTRRGFRRKQA